MPMPRLLSILSLLFALTVLGLAQPTEAQRIGPTSMQQAGSSAQPARLCGTNSSRSRRCNFGYRDCNQSGKSQATCDKALGICRSCIDTIVACMRQTSTTCADCHQRYDVCMQPWLELMDGL